MFNSMHMLTLIYKIGTRNKTIFKDIYRFTLCSYKWDKLTTFQTLKYTRTGTGTRPNTTCVIL